MRCTLIVLTLFALSLRLVSAATVSGKVVDVHGKPINGAHVLVSFWLNEGENEGEEETYDLLTDAEGGYTAAVDPNLPVQSAMPGEIVAYAPGYALVQESFKGSDNPLTLVPGTTVSGVVVDANNKPLAGVAVRLHRCSYGDNQYADLPDEWRSRFTAVSAADGSWTLPGAPLNGTASVEVADDLLSA